MKKIVYGSLFMLSIASLIHCMEHVINDEKKEDSNALSQQNPEINTPTINVSRVPHLNLGSSLPKYKSVRATPKTPIKSHNDLTQQVNGVKKSYRQPLSESVGMILKQSQDTAIDINNISNMHSISAQKKSLLPSGIGNNDLITNVAQGTLYSIEQVWDFLKATNPVLHQFGIDHDMSLDDVMMYGSLLNDFHVHPEALVEYVKSNVKLDSKKLADWQLKNVNDRQIQKYQNIQRKDPDKYQAIVLDVLKAVCEEQDGENKPSPLNDTHIGLLEKQAANSEGTIRYQYIALFVGLFLTLAGYAWGIYGQATGHTSAPTHAPTGTPTMQPTFMPTGSPT